METSRNPRVPMSEQIKLINECRRSGMTDADWCREHHISPSTFYTWISRCRKAVADQILPPSYGHSDRPCARQDVVPVRIIPDHVQENIPAPCLPTADPHLDNSHTIEVFIQNLTIRICNEADPVLLGKTFQLLQETLC